MHDYCPDAPSVDLFTADEELVVTIWFEIDHPSYGPRIDDIFDGWNIPSEIPDYRCIDAAVAQILLERLLRATALSLLEAILIAGLAEKSSCGLTTC